MPTILLMLPGMGATSAMYAGPWRDLPDVRFADWPEYRGECVVEDFAHRIVEEYRAGGYDVVGGSSFGGIVAQEVARRAGIHRVLLLGSAEHPDELNSALRMLAPIAQITPWKLLQTLAGVSRTPVSEQFVHSDARFLRAAGSAISTWEGSVFEGEVLRIHGSNDRIIHCPPKARVIAGAGHLLALTHARECVDMVSQSLFNDAAT